MPAELSGGDASLYWRAGIDESPFMASIRKMENELRGLSGNVQQQGDYIESFFKRAAVAAGSFFSLQSGANFIKQLVDVRGEFQQLEVAFTTMLKSKEQANALLQQVTQLASTTPFTMTEVATGAKQLLAYGTEAKDVTETLSMLGNVAAGVSAPIGDIVYLYGTLQTQGRAYTKDIQQFTGRGIPIIQELAKQFKVSKEEVQGLVEAGKVGFPEVQKAFQSLTGSSGIFYNLMQEQSKTLTGQLSNLSDAFDQMLNNIGRSNQSIFSTAISGATDLIENYQKVLDLIQGLIVAYGAYRAAVLVSATYTKLLQANSVGYVAALSNETVAKIANTEAALENMRAEVSAAAAKKAAAVQTAAADLQALRAATERLTVAKAAQAASAADIYSSARAADAKALLIAEEEVLAAKETASISRKAALSASSEFYTAQQGLETAAKEASAVATVELTEVEALNAAGKRVLTGVQAAYNSVMAAAPMVAYAAGLAAVAAVVYALTADTNALHRAQEALNEITLEANKNVIAETSKLDSLKRVISDTTRSEKDRLSAVKALREIMGDRLKQYSDEELLAKKATKAIADYRQEIIKTARANAAQGKIQELESQLLATDVNSQIAGTRREKVNAAFDNIPLRERLKFSLLSGDKRGGAINANNEDALDDYRQFLKDQKAAILSAYGATIDDVNAKITSADDGLSEAEKARLARFGNNLKDSYTNFKALIKDARGEDDFKKINDALEVDKKKLTPTIGPEAEQINRIKARQAELAKITSQYGVGSLAKSQKAEDDALKQRNAIYEKLGGLHQEYLQNQKTQDEREIEQTRYKYDQLLKEVADYNAKHKQKIDPAKLNVDRNGNIVDRPAKGGRTLNVYREKENAVNNVTARQQLEKDKVIYDARKQLFEQYEDYKAEYGKDAADRLYSAELGEYASYVGYLQGLLNGIEGKTDAGSNALRDYLSKELPKAQKEASAKAYQDNLRNLKRINDATKTAASERTRIDKQYEDDKASLEKNRSKYTESEYNDRLEKLVINHGLELQQVRELAIQETAIYKDATAAITNLSLEALKKRIQQAKQEIGQSDLSGDARKLYIQKLNTAESELNSRGYHTDQFGQQIDDYNEVAANAKKIAAYSQQIESSFSDLANSIAPFNEGLADTLSTISQLAGVAGNGANAVGQFASGDIVGGIASTIKAVTGVINIFGAAKESERKAKAEMQNYYDSLIKNEIAYNQLLRERARTQKEIAGMTTLELRARQQLLEMQKKQAQADYNKFLAQIQSSGQQITGQHTEKYGGVLGIGRKTRVVQELAGLGSADYEQLEQLYTEGKLTDATKGWFEELKKMHDEFDSIGESAEEAMVQINRIATGTTAADIANVILEGFKQGKRSAADFADTFQELMQNALLSSFQANYLNGKIEEFYKQFAESANSDGGLTEDKIALLRYKYQTIIDDAGKQLDAIGAIAGTKVGSGNSSGSSASGRLSAALTEATASKIEGVLSGIHLTTTLQLTASQQMIADGWTRHNQMVRYWERNLQLAIRIESNTRRSADLSEKYLPLIADNTGKGSDSLTGLLRAAGKV